ncbi:TPM domain-containing protein [Rufibacter roseus]|uniref:TPM domain-containing protein n=1 Tax=Rufibacter roseus TaxID=1567108 RepID=A0ABW2DQS2_9BACT|nr:TPM domain-containing protein [Rufibacter roseus]
MKNRRFIFLLVMSLSFVTYSCTAQEAESKNQNLELVALSLKESKFPKPIGYVNDFENILSKEQIKELTEIITSFERKTTNQIAVVTISSVEPYSDFDQYALDLSKEWGVGRKEKNNGLTIVFSKSLSKIRISTGLGTEKVLTDEICQSIIDQFMVPKFKEGQFYDGISSGLTELIKHWK